MPRYLLLILFLVFVVPGYHAQAAMSAEAQQMKEKRTVLESEELEGHSVTGISRYEDEEGRYYEVDAKISAEEMCTYKFRVDYPVSFYALLGMVGPKKFTVKMDGEHSCQPVGIGPTPSGDLKTTVFEFIAETYEIAMSDISPDMSLYRVLEKQQKPTMDFRILILRQQLEEELECHIATDQFMAIRTVSDLLTLSNEYCDSLE